MAEKIESEMVDTILEKVKDKTFKLSIDQILWVLLWFYDKVLLEQDLHEVLTHFPDLGKIIPDFGDWSFWSTTFIDKFDELTKKMAKEMKVDQLKFVFSLLNLVFHRKENARKPSNFYYSDWRDYLDSLNFYFDLLNDIAGYTSKYYDEMQMTHEEWEKSMVPKWGQTKDPYFDQSFPHILIHIENAECLNRHYDQWARDYLDTIILRMYQENGFRKHFPVVLESSDPQFFHWEVHELMLVPNDVFAVLDLHTLTYAP